MLSDNPDCKSAIQQSFHLRCSVNQNLWQDHEWGRSADLHVILCLLHKALAYFRCACMMRALNLSQQSTDIIILDFVNSVLHCTAYYKIYTTTSQNPALRQPF